jgi:hypothetical protein
MLAIEESITGAAHNSSLARGGPFESLAILQHHGAATRLLDVTIDPIAALWFATQDEGRWNEDGVLFAINSKRLNSVAQVSDGKSTSGFEPQFLKADGSSARLTAQRGAFVVLPIKYPDYRDFIEIADLEPDSLQLSDLLKDADGSADPSEAASPPVVALTFNAGLKKTIRTILEGA